MPPRTGQKRTAPSSAPEGSRSGAGAGPSSKGPKPKKTRFAEPSEDPAKFAEDVDSALEDPLAKRKGRVRNEGYDSDSTDDGEGVVLSRRTAAAASGVGDDDMFTLVENQPVEKDASGKKKEDYLRLGDIEGQEFGAESDSGLSSEENEPEDEDDAERRKKAGMGFELSSFNMREEMEEGKFSADGTYVRSFDPHGVHDRWMEEFNEKDIKMARRRKKQRERQEKEKLKAEARELEQSGGKDELQKALIPMLKKGETILEALQRLGAHAKQSKPAPPRQR
jgi:CD2 antigen cytoplasmic tail-binding protein 2